MNTVEFFKMFLMMSGVAFWLILIAAGVLSAYDKCMIKRGEKIWNKYLDSHPDEKKNVTVKDRVYEIQREIKSLNRKVQRHS